MTAPRIGCLILLNAYCLNSSLLASLPRLLSSHLSWAGLRREERRRGKESRMYKLGNGKSLQTDRCVLSGETQQSVESLKLSETSPLLWQAALTFNSWTGESSEISATLFCLVTTLILDICNYILTSTIQTTLPFMCMGFLIKDIHN